MQGMLSSPSLTRQALSIFVTVLALSLASRSAEARVPFGANGGVVDFVDVVKGSTWDDTSALDADGWPLGDNSVTLIDARHNIHGGVRLALDGGGLDGHRSQPVRATQLANVTSYVDIGTTFFPPDPQVGIAYTYTVQANNGFGSSGDSAAVSVTPSVSVPDAPTHLSAQIAMGGVFLSWTPPFGMLPVFFPMQYNVYRSTSPTSGFALVTQISTATFVDKSAVVGTKYHYVVTASKSVGDSPQSNRVSITR